MNSEPKFIHMNQILLNKHIQIYTFSKISRSFNTLIMPSHCDHHHSARTPQSIAFAGEHPRATSVRDDRPGAVWSLAGQICERNPGNPWFSGVVTERAGPSTKHITWCQNISNLFKCQYVDIMFETCWKHVEIEHVNETHGLHWRPCTAGFSHFRMLHPGQRVHTCSTQKWMCGDSQPEK